MKRLTLVLLLTSASALASDADSSYYFNLGTGVVIPGQNSSSKAD